MIRRIARAGATALLAALVGWGCSGQAAVSHAAVNHAAAPAPPAPQPSAEEAKSIHQPTDAMRALGIYQPYSDADINFMTGMIPHHAQAVIMAGWAPTHGVGKDLAPLCERIVVGQRDEIHMMQQWLRDRGLPVPDEHDTRMHMVMNGMQHDMLMPGMLTDEEMAALDKARGTDFDRLFLQGMIKHHQGAIDMVNDLFKSYGAAQDDKIYKFASDVFADQSIEIDVMHKMLDSLGGSK